MKVTEKTVKKVTYKMTLSLEELLVLRALVGETGGKNPKGVDLEEMYEALDDVVSRGKMDIGLLKDYRLQTESPILFEK